MITKLGNDLKKNIEENKLLNAGIAGYGALTIKDQIQRGNLTGRETLYHGTQPEYVQSILDQGIHASSDKNAVNTAVLKRAKPEVYKDSLGKVYLTRSKLDAAGYTGAGKARLKNPDLPINNPLDTLDARLTGKGRVAANVPVWMKETVRNPETAMGFAKWHDDLDWFTKAVTPKMALKDMYNRMDKAVVIKGALEPKYIRGSKEYTPNSAREVVKYLANNKLRAAKGLGVTGLGGLGVYYGINNIAKNYDKTTKTDNNNTK